MQPYFLLVSLVDYCKIVGVEGEKCEKVLEFIQDACPQAPSEPEPVLWKGRDMRQEWQDLYKKLTGG
jgi:hypothetical protein